MAGLRAVCLLMLVADGATAPPTMSPTAPLSRNPSVPPTMPLTLMPLGFSPFGWPQWETQSPTASTKSPTLPPTASPTIRPTVGPDTTNAPSRSPTAADDFPFRAVAEIDNARWEGFITDSTPEAAAEEAYRRGAKGFFESKPKQFHFVFDGDSTFDVRTEGDYPVTALYSTVPTPPPPAPFRAVAEIDNARWEGFITDSTPEAAAEEAHRRGAKGFFESGNKPKQFHFIFNGERTFDVRTEGGYNVIALYSTLSFKAVAEIRNARWEGFITDSTPEAAAEEAYRRGAKGFFESRPKQFHFVFDGDSTFDVRTEGGFLAEGDYRVTALYSTVPTPPPPAPVRDDDTSHKYSGKSGVSIVMVVCVSFVGLISLCLVIAFIGEGIERCCQHYGCCRGNRPAFEESSHNLTESDERIQLCDSVEMTPPTRPATLPRTATPPADKAMQPPARRSRPMPAHPYGEEAEGKVLKDIDVGDAIAPVRYTCTITMHLMQYPVMTKDGHNYEYDAIADWVGKTGMCPQTRKPLRLEDLSPNRALKEDIEEWIKVNTQQQEQQLEQQQDTLPTPPTLDTHTPPPPPVSEEGGI